MSFRNFFRVLAATLSLSVVLATYAVDPPLSNKWRLQISGGAESDGTLTFRVTPEDGQPVDVTVTLEDGRSENGVARDIREAFRAQLPKDSYSVETDDGEDVLIKKHLGEPSFGVELVASSVDDVRVNFDRE